MKNKQRLILVTGFLMFAMHVCGQKNYPIVKYITYSGSFIHLNQGGDGDDDAVFVAKHPEYKKYKNPVLQQFNALVDSLISAGCKLQSISQMQFQNEGKEDKNLGSGRWLDYLHYIIVCRKDSVPITPGCGGITVSPTTCSLLNGQYVCSGVAEMGVASSGAVRSLSLFIDHFTRIDEVDITVCNATNGANVFQVYSIKFGDLVTQTQIAVNANSLSNTIAPNDKILCTYRIYGVK